MRKIIGFVFALFVLASCEKDSDVVCPQIEDVKPAGSFTVESFLSSNKLSFQGNLEQETFNWQFAAGEQNFQSSKTFCYVGKSELCNPNRNFTFSLSQNTRQNHVQVQLPTINIASKAAFNRIFGIGKKNLADFNITITKGSTVLQLDKNSLKGEIEILKTREETHSSDKVIRIWFRIKADFQDSKNDIAPLNGFLLAEFSGLNLQSGNCGSN